jgi:Tol biopolymer transport system component
VTTGNQIVESMRITRDGQWLVYDSNIHGNSDIYRIRLPDGAPERVTNEHDDVFRGDLSPDGKELAYQAWRTGSRDIYVHQLNEGERPTQTVTNSPKQEAGPIWSPDGRSLAFVDIAGAPDLYVVNRNSDGHWQRPIARGVGGPGSADWSPDSKSIVVASAGAIRVVDAATGGDRILYTPRAGTADPAADQVVWFRDGRTMYFKSHDDVGRASLWSIPSGGGAPRLLVRFSELTRPSNRPDFATDGRRLYFAIQDRQSDIWVADLTKGTNVTPR